MSFQFTSLKSYWVLLSGTAILGVAIPAQAQHRFLQPNCPPPPCADVKPLPAVPVAPEGQPPVAPVVPAPADVGYAATGGDSFAASSPAMVGDFSFPSNTNSARGVARVISTGGFKMGENDSPRPTDRIFFNYNYFDNFNGLFNIHREIIGFEKTFHDGNGSFGLRLPWIQLDGGGTGGEDFFGNLTITSKYAFINNRDNGNVLSGGLLLTLPTGDDDIVGDYTIWQPWLGFIVNGDNAYILGFSSVALASQSDVADIWFNDIAVGYWLYRSNNGQGLTGIVPTLELHVNTPLDNTVSDWIVLTFGTHLIFNNSSSLTLAIGTPISGPQPYDIEAALQFNLRF